MKKTIIAVACAAFISTGAMAKPASHHGTQPHNNPPTHTMNHNAKPAVHAHTGHHNPTPYVAHVRPAPAPAPVYHHHHHHNDDAAVLIGDAIIAFAILATNAM